MVLGTPAQRAPYGSPYMPGYTLVDFFSSYKFDQGVELGFNVNNVFDRDPPISPSQSQRGGQQGVANGYDVFGRRYQLSVNYTF